MRKSEIQNNEYLAFISYQRKDEAIAKRLQHTLEFYNLPLAVVEKEPELKDGIRPIFVDMTELGDEPFLKPAIEKALKKSRFLIVICSPKSAKSKWVNKEVQYFIRLKRTKQIIPFIIEGAPNAQEDEECCTPLMQRLLGKRELLGININEMGFDAAAVKVVSRMFHIGFRTLWNRYEKEKEEEQRKLKEQNDRLLIAQSRFIAEKANDLIDKGDSFLARLLALEALPKDLDNPDRPYVAEAEAALRKASKYQSCILRGHSDSVRSISFSSDGQFIVSASEDRTVRLWDAKTGRQIGLPMRGHTSYVYSAYFSPDGKRIVSASEDKTIRIWDTETRRQIGRPLEGHTWAVLCASFSPDGKRIVSGSFDKTIRIWDATTGMQIGKPLIGHSWPVYSVSYSPDGKHIVSASEDMTIRIWEADTGRQFLQLEGHKKNVRSAYYSPDGKCIVSASGDKTIRIWSAKTGRKLGKLHEELTGELFMASFSPDGKRIYQDQRTRQ